LQDLDLINTGGHRVAVVVKPVPHGGIGARQVTHFALKSADERAVGSEYARAGLARFVQAEGKRRVGRRLRPDLAGQKNSRPNDCENIQAAAPFMTRVNVSDKHHSW
jgi:hypothetical protein